jgi:hypothetical protein
MPRTKTAPVASDPFDITTRVFLSYRREDSSLAVQHLRESLGRLIGEDKIFRDVDSIPLGTNFETVIGDAIRAASVCLVVIGPNWLTAARNGRRRLNEPEDYVRIEVESALRAGIEVIPVLVDGATMPHARELPPSIAGLAKLNAQVLPWQTGIAKLSARIDQIERRRLAEEAKLQAERDRLDLTGGKRVRRAAWKSKTAIASFNVVIRVMELSLARQGLRVFLSPADLAAAVTKVAGHTLEHGFFIGDLLHVIDFVGIKAKTSDNRYVARSFPVRSLVELERELRLGRPLLTSVRISRSPWYEKSVMKTGFIDKVDPDGFMGAITGGVLGWDPLRQQLKVLMPWPDWGQHGIATLTRQAAEATLTWEDTRSVEAVLMPKLRNA